MHDGNDASDADLAVLEHQLRTQEPLAPDETADAIVVDTDALRQKQPTSPTLVANVRDRLARSRRRRGVESRRQHRCPSRRRRAFDESVRNDASARRRCRRLRAISRARKLAILAHLQPDMRWDHPGLRLKALLVNGFLQSRMVRGEWKPGLMHAVIFLGFMSLLLRKLQLIAIGYDESTTFPGLAGGLFAGFKDGVEIAVLAACGYALYRRLVQKPRRLERNREALLILGADHFDHGHRFCLRRLSLRGALGKRSACGARARLRVRRQRDRVRHSPALPPPALRAGYQFFYWTQLLIVFAFLVILPTGEHFHIVTALPALFFRRGRTRQRRAGRRSRKGDGRATTEMRIGARSARDLTLEGRARRIHLHRMRPLQGRVPDLPHRQAAGAQVGVRQRQAPSAGSARRAGVGELRTTRCRPSCPT